MISFKFSICKFTQNFWIIHRHKEKNNFRQIQLASTTKLQKKHFPADFGQLFFSSFL